METDGEATRALATDKPQIHGLDLEDPTRHYGPPKSSYATRFITTHKNACRCAAFSADGKFVATGSTDTSIKLLDVNKMLQFGHKADGSSNAPQGVSIDDVHARPVVKTFYDHTQTVNDVAFHPTLSILASASRDNTIKLYDYMSTVKRAHNVLQDTHNVRCIAFHPCGDYLLAGADHAVLRLFDIASGQCYINPRSQGNHLGPINQVAYSHDGKMFASASKDGSVKLWDGVSSNCVHTITNAHGGTEVSSVQFSRNFKYFLTGGKDSIARVWSVAMPNRPVLQIYFGNPQAPQQRLRLQTRWSFNEDHILCAEENGSATLVYDTRTQEVLQRLTGHNQVVRYIAVSPVEPHIMTCSDDHRARFWVDENLAGRTV
jgi:cleavage stimulation factor subunit 1